MKTLISAALIVITALAPAQDDVQLIQSLRNQSNQAIARHDIDTVQALLAGDFVISISNGNIERSRAEHGRTFAAHFAQFPDVIYVRTPDDITISSAYDLAIETGTWTGSRSTANGKLENGGQYTAAWKKTADGWRIYSELYVALYCRGEDC